MFTSSIEDLGFVSQQVVFCVRILISMICGGLIGLERTKRFKEAGIRTHCIVAGASAALMILSKYGFSDLVSATGNFFAGVEAADAARIAAQIITGVGFLGAAVVFKQGGSVHGLTTAAGIWATSAVGMVIGAGMYVIGIFLTLVLILILFVMHRHNIGNDAFTVVQIKVSMDDDENLEKIFMNELEKKKTSILETSMSRFEGKLNITLMVRMKEEFTYEDIRRILKDNPGIHSISA